MEAQPPSPLATPADYFNQDEEKEHASSGPSASAWKQVGILRDRIVEVFDRLP